MHSKTSNLAWGYRLHQLDGDGVSSLLRQQAAGGPRRSGVALVDQGLFAGANFLVNILLARWLPPEQYGAFTVAYSIFLLLAGFHTAVLTEPMMVFGPGKYSEKFPLYIGILLYAHWILTAGISVILAGAAIVVSRFGSPDLAQALLGVSAASPFILLLWFVRRAYYATFQSGTSLSLRVDACYLVLVVVFIGVLTKSGTLAPTSAYLVMGLAAFVASVWLLSLRPHLRLRGEGSMFKLVLRDHQVYGGWNILGVVAHWFSGEVLMLVLPLTLGLSAPAIIAGVANLFRPIHLVMQSATLVILPMLSTIVQRRDHREALYRGAMKFLYLFGGGVLLYGILVSAFGSFILHSLYSGKYDGHGVLILLMALTYAASACVQVLTLAIKSMGDTRPVVRIWMLSGLLTLVLSVPAARLAGLEGAVAVVFMSSFVAFIMAWSTITGLTRES